jgi:hypothetical protein
MRPIKFRAWDEDNKRMFTPQRIDADGDNKVYDGYGCYDMPVMQFTGLTDKNGKEIYEGDILIDEANRKRIVVFDYGAFKVMWNNDNPTQLNLYPLNKHWEVVGNIHENPELLENKE